MIDGYHGPYQGYEYESDIERCEQVVFEAKLNRCKCDITDDIEQERERC